MEISDQGLRSTGAGRTQQGPKLWQEIAQTAPLLQLVPWVFPVRPILQFFLIPRLHLSFLPLLQACKESGSDPTLACISSHTLQPFHMGHGTC